MPPTSRRPTLSPYRRSLPDRIRAVLEDPLRQLQLSVALLLTLVMVGTVCYRLVEGMGWLDALYMTVITIGTVGFKEVQPLSPAGQLLTIALIVVGVGMGAWAASNLVEVALGQTVWTTSRRRKMKQTLAGLRDHYVVCGHGRLGTRIVRDLAARGESFVVIDLDERLEAPFMAAGVPYIIGDATHDEVLTEARVDHARGMVAALDSDASNVMAVLTAREMNPRLLIVSRANADHSESKLRRAGANRVVTPDDIGGHRLALALLRPAVHDLFNEIFSFGMDGSVDVGQITIPHQSPFAGQTVAGCDLRRVRNLSILAVREREGGFVLNPDAQRVLEAGETMIVIGPAEAVYELEALYGDE